MARLGVRFRSRQSQQKTLAFWARLLQAGLYTNVSLPPATPKGLALLRSSVSAAHGPAQLDHAIALFASAGREMGLIPPAISPARGMPDLASAK